MGAEHIIDRSAEGYKFWKDESTQDQKEWKRFGARIRELTGGNGRLMPDSVQSFKVIDCHRIRLKCKISDKCVFARSRPPVKTGSIQT
jgi:hypothetical protein